VAAIWLSFIGPAMVVAVLQPAPPFVELMKPTSS